MHGKLVLIQVNASFAICGSICICLGEACCLASALFSMDKSRDALGPDFPCLTVPLVLLRGRGLSEKISHAQYCAVLMESLLWLRMQPVDVKKPAFLK